MKRKLIIVGAGNVGGFIAHHANDFGEYEVLGFVDDDTSKHGSTFCRLPILGGLNYLQQLDYPVDVAIAIANPVVKSRLLSKLHNIPSLTFPSFVHPNSWLGNNVSIGTGTIIYPGVLINYESKIGDFITINMNVAIGHDCTLMDFSTISPGANLGGFTEVGEQSFLGIGAATIQSTKIGRTCIVGAGTIVIRDIPDGATVVGNPGRIVKYKKID